MASKAQRRERYLRRRAHALGLDYDRLLRVPRKYIVHTYYRRSPAQELEIYGETYLTRSEDGVVEHLARDIIEFANKYMVSGHRMLPWQERVIKDVVRTL